jgi:hypothetical protein
MNDLRTRLQEGDPIAHERGLSPDDRDRMRRQILTAKPVAASAPNRVFLVLAATLVLVTAGAALLTHRLASRTAEVSEVAGSQSAIDAPTVRELQFATPGGTRLIWIFNPNLPVR